MNKSGLAVMFVLVPLCSYGMGGDEQERLMDFADEEERQAPDDRDEVAVRPFDLSAFTSLPAGGAEHEPEHLASQFVRAAGIGFQDQHGARQRVAARLAAFRDRRGTRVYGEFIQGDAHHFGLGSTHRGASVQQPDMVALFERMLESKEKELDALHRENELRIELERARQQAREAEALASEDVPSGWRIVGIFKKHPGKAIIGCILTLVMTNGGQILERVFAKNC